MVSPYARLSHKGVLDNARRLDEVVGTRGERRPAHGRGKVIGH